MIAINTQILALVHSSGVSWDYVTYLVFLNKMHVISQPSFYFCTFIEIYLYLHVIFKSTLKYIFRYNFRDVILSTLPVNFNSGIWRRRKN